MCKSFTAEALKNDGVFQKMALTVAIVDTWLEYNL